MFLLTGAKQIFTKVRNFLFIWDHTWEGDHVIGQLHWKLVFSFDLMSLGLDSFSHLYIIGIRYPQSRVCE
ncbi:hypothetical protein EHQ58_09820 [Leptospira ognonensis]|uniref:Uncharacterized protein n=1 Tax=Leptospira ognonensis TaxID=2484945 RepID=A0A4R9K4L7_9LEPT|nr:hypothetical protein [Leptospira ognonensis]TGL59197.1 hypothetical protein EHQ58_09820 [Leptospira ognonensis]